MAINRVFFSIIAATLLAAGSMTVEAAEVPKQSDNQDEYCIELNGFGLPAGYLNLRLIISVEDDSVNEKYRLKFYKAVKSPLTDEILYVFDKGSISDVYVVVVVDPGQKSIRRRFTYGSLHYPCPKKS